MKTKKIIIPAFKKEDGFVTSAERSERMRNIRGKNTKPELALRKRLYEEGYRYRINVKKLPGSPDIVLRKHMLVIFVDGEFWHGYNWEEKKKRIKDNRAFWIPKIERNMQRDRENEEKLKAMGFTILRFWEAEIKKDIQACVEKIKSVINK